MYTYTHIHTYVRIYNVFIYKSELFYVFTYFCNSFGKMKSTMLPPWGSLKPKALFVTSIFLVLTRKTGVRSTGLANHYQIASFTKYSAPTTELL